MKALISLREFIKQEKTGKYLKLLKQNESITKDELFKLQCFQLRDLFRYINKYSPYYSSLFGRNQIDINKLNGLNVYEVFKELPIIDKSLIKSNFNEFLSTNPDVKVHVATTSGSTGVPFKLCHSAISRDIKLSQKFRLLNWHGVNRWEKQFYLGCTYGPPISIMNKLKIYVNNKLIWNRHIIDFTDINESKIQHLISRINREKPVTIWGYPSVIFEIAKYSITNKLPINDEKLRLVITSGESLSESMKQTITEAFKVNVADEYNSNEGFIAGTCEFGILHIMEDTLITEVIKEDGSIADSGFGELLVTFLYSYDFPFIRYKIGDLVNITDSRCACGRTFKSISAVEGRKGSVILNGKEKISSATCNHYVTKSSFINTIHQYQIIQNDRTSVTVKLVVTDKKRDYSEFEKLMSGLFNNLAVRFEYVNEIPRHQSGKFVDVISSIIN